MAELIRCYRQDVGALRFIGKKYGDEDRTDGGFDKQWGDFASKGWKLTLDSLPKAAFEDGDAYIGLMRWKDGEPFQYWVGMFLPEGTEVPDGFGHVDFPPASMGVCWLRGKEDSLYMQEGRCATRLMEEGYTIIPDDEGACWFFERYSRARFDTQDEDGNAILDIVHYIK